MGGIERQRRASLCLLYQFALCYEFDTEPTR